MMRTIKIFLVCMTAVLSVSGQNLNDSNKNISIDVIVKTNGNLFQCKILEVNDSLVNYTLPLTDTTGNILNVPRNEVYAIAYGNGIAQVLNPVLMGKEASIYPETMTGWDKLKNNLGKGILNVGVGFIDGYSPLKDVKSFDDEKVMPSVFVGYTFDIKKKIQGGMHIGVASNKLSKSGVSEYDQLKLSAEIDQFFINVGLYGRYNFTDGIFKPYVKAGVDFIGVSMKTTSTAESLDGSKQSLQTKVEQSGIKLWPILRGGMDVFFSDRFGIYGDVGTGLSLVQFGALLRLE